MLSDIDDPFAVGLPGGLPRRPGSVTWPRGDGLRRPAAAIPDCGGEPHVPRLPWQASETFEELRCPGNHARADVEIPDPSSRAAQIRGTANSSLTGSPEGPHRAYPPACVRGVPERRLARFHPRPALAFDAAQLRRAGRGSRDPAGFRDH